MARGIGLFAGLLALLTAHAVHARPASALTTVAPCVQRVDLGSRDCSVGEVVAYGADPTGIADSAPSFQACLDAAGKVGGVCSGARGRFRLNSTITIPVGATLDCGMGNLGPGTNAASPYPRMSALISNVGRGVAIENAGPATFRNCLVLPYGMTFPQTSSSAWQGTAIQVGAGAGGAGDFKVENVMTLGWNQCLTSTANDRGVIRDFYCDGNNGEYIASSFDTWQIEHVHNWPYASVGANGGSPPAVDLERSGVGLELYGRNDHTSIQDVLSLGYQTNFLFAGTANGTGAGCCNVYADDLWSDIAPGDARANTIGFDFEGVFGNIQLGTIWVWGTHTGVKISGLNQNYDIYVGNLYSDMVGQDSILLTDGALTIGRVDIAQPGRWGINVYSDGATLNIVSGGFHFGGHATEPCPIGIAPGATTQYINISDRVTMDGSWSGKCLVGGSPLHYQTIASATALTLPFTSGPMTLNVSGATNIHAISPPSAGTGAVTLIFRGILTVVNGTSSAGQIALNGGSNFTTAGGSTLTLVYDPDGVSSGVGLWREVSRTTP